MNRLESSQYRDVEGLSPEATHLLAERTRVAHELHETMLQEFSAVSVQLRAAAEQVPADWPVKVRFDDALNVMDRVLEQGRRAVRGLRLPLDQYPSLGHALAHVPNDLGLPSSGFRVVVEGRRRELRAGLSEQLYCIGREAIVNAHRHSCANQIETEIEYRPAELRILVRDNGCGIDASMLRRKGHWGLQDMRERAERIGARLRILSKVALGTEVELCVPSRVAFERSGFRATC